MASPLKPKIAIGNAKCKQSYSPDDKAFHSSDIPDAARRARLETKAWKKPLILGTERPAWSAETAVPTRLCVRASSQLIDTSWRQRATAPAVDESDVGGGWQASTQFSEADALAKVAALDFCLIIECMFDCIWLVVRSMRQPEKCH
jgi:hypothetical protein